MILIVAGVSYVALSAGIGIAFYKHENSADEMDALVMALLWPVAFSWVGGCAARDYYKLKRTPLKNYLKKKYELNKAKLIVYYRQRSLDKKLRNSGFFRHTRKQRKPLKRVDN